MKEILEAGGSGFLLPAVLFLLVLYTVRGVYGLHGRRSQYRREFLELWDKSRSADDLWLEVSVRHLFGAYLPTRVVQLALDQPDRSRSLADLSEIWVLLTFDPVTQTVRWRSKWRARLIKSRLGSALFLVAYVLCAIAAVLAGSLAAHNGHTSVGGWIYGVSAVVVGFLAVICLMHD